MAILLDPSIVLAASDHYVDVQIDSGLTRGMSVVDRLGVAKDPRNQEVWREVPMKHKVIWEIDNSRWKQALRRALQ